MRKFTFLLPLLLTLVSVKAQKNVVFEELTGTWCQYCPSGIYYSDSLMFTYDNVIFVAIHTGDAMAYEDYANLSGLTGAPTANINRRQKKIDVESWFSKYQDENNIDPRVSVSINNEYNEETRHLKTTLTTTALTTTAESFKFGAILVEDGVTGPAPAYNQNNAYSGGNYGPMGGWENLPNPVPAERMAYDHVARHLMSDYFGDGETPSPFNIGESVSYSFEYDIPEEYNPNYIRIVGLILHEEDKYIENSVISNYLSGQSNASPLFTSNPRTEAYVNLNYLYNFYFHDPDNKEIIATAIQKPDWMSFEQYDNKSAVIYGVPLEEGDYDVTLQIFDGENITAQNFTIEVKSSLGGEWEYVGERGFTQEGECTPLDMDSYENINYIFIKQGDYAVVYKSTNSGNWEQMGNIATKIDFSGADMDIASNGDVYISFTEPDGWDYIGHVKKWDGTAWNEVGNVGPAIELHISLDNNDVPYVSCRYGIQYQSFVYKFDNGEWNVVGDGPYNESGIWASIKIGNDNCPYVFACNSQHQPMVFKFENGTWNMLGGDIVCNTDVYYYMDMLLDENDNIYITFVNQEDRSVDVYKYDGLSWAQTGNNISGGAVSHLDMSIKNNYPIISYTDQTLGDYVSVKYFDGENWNYVGSTTFSEGASDYPQITIYQSMAYVAFTEKDMNDVTSCMRYHEQSILYPPTNFQANVFNSDCVELTWDIPVEGSPTAYRIYRNYNKIAEVNDLSYKDYNLPAGTYHYTLTAVYGSEESLAVGPITVETTLYIEDVNNEEYKCYPTITNNNITIESTDSGIASIISVNGMIIKNLKIEKGENTIDLSSLKAGLYFIRFEGNNDNWVDKVVKK